MKLSKKGEYALRSMIGLGIAAEVGRTLVQLPEVAANEQLPQKFLEQIMLRLREEKLVVGVRGKFGGYRLAKPAAKITIGSIIRVIDGPLAPLGCVSQSAYQKCTCPDEAHCGLRMLMLDVRNAITGILDRYTLADVVEVTLRKLRRGNQPLPYTPESEAVPVRVPATHARRLARRATKPRLDETEGVLHQLLGDYTI